MYPRATYTRVSSVSDLTITPLPASTPPVRWSSISEPDISPLPEAHPIHVTVEAGNTLYLPAGWWHHVRQSGQTVIALNWWYDMEMSGMSWVFLSFLRGVTTQNPDEAADDMECTKDR